jgi:hypothetical protein
MKTVDLFLAMTAMKEKGAEWQAFDPFLMLELSPLHAQ